MRVRVRLRLRLRKNGRSLVGMMTMMEFDRPGGHGATRLFGYGVCLLRCAARFRRWLNLDVLPWTR